MGAGSNGLLSRADSCPQYNDCYLPAEVLRPLGPASRRWQIAMTRQAAILLARQIELLLVVRLRGTCGEGLGRHFPNLNLEYFFFPVS